MIRFVGNLLHPTDYARVDAWALRLKSWLGQGLRRAYFFIHQPDNINAPELAAVLIERIHEVCGIEIRRWEPWSQTPQMALF
jgi:hypothetical protein